ncbi:hypothetical protein GSI_07423 [Ganoderma sinense ZZ0214-1]|uniref:Uncharacterized protein n=1 Tax=Ganoderma sinense ZZ0214-1 TaxID=1077348 RepID=A0A2G8S919_9APHY|nr:hypothetical protein GSI_07423 [Ganoderma sinense ZZ0214-1]
MSQEPKKFKIAELPSTPSRSVINALQIIIDRLGPRDPDSSTQMAQLSSNFDSLNISRGSQSSLLPPFSRPSQPDARSAQVVNLAQALTAKLQRHLRKRATEYHYAALQAFLPCNDLPGHSLKLRCLPFKPDGKQRARERGAHEVEGNPLTLEMTEHLVNLAYRHTSHNTDLGFRLVTEIILLRLAAVLRASAESDDIRLLTDCPVRAVELPGEDPSQLSGGVVDYILAKHQHRAPRTSTAAGTLAEDIAGTLPSFQKIGAANIFYVSSVLEVTYGLPHSESPLSHAFLLCSALNFDYEFSCRSGQEAMRAAVTNGESWLFLAYKRSAESPGAGYYAASELFDVRVAEDTLHVDWILGVLIDWVRAARGSFPAPTPPLYISLYDAATLTNERQVENTGNCDAFEYFEDPAWDIPARR